MTDSKPNKSTTNNNLPFKIVFYSGQAICLYLNTIYFSASMVLWLAHLATNPQAWVLIPAWAVSVQPILPFILIDKQIPGKEKLPYI